MMGHVCVCLLQAGRMKDHLNMMKDPKRRGSNSSIQADRFDKLLGIFITKARTHRYSCCDTDPSAWDPLLPTTQTLARG